jgi:hypothetical protein
MRLVKEPISFVAANCDRDEVVAGQEPPRSPSPLPLAAATGMLYAI